MKRSPDIVDHAPLAAGASVLVSGASFAGLATAYWMNLLGYKVTVVEIADGLRRGGTPVDIEEGTVDIVRRMGMLDAVRAKSLPRRATEFKTADDVTEARLPLQPAVLDGPDEHHEIHRDDLLDILFDAVAADVDFVFGRSIVRLDQQPGGVTVWFDDGSQREFALVFGCDGNRSNVRRLAFGDADDATYFMENYFLLKVVDKAFIESNLTQIFSVPGKTIMLNSYDGKTDIGFGFHAAREIAYDYRDKAEQRRMIRAQFEELGWRTPELLREIDADDDFYFDKLCQIRMPGWTKGRVALVGDAGYCASPAAGMGGSLAIIGATALADAFERHGGDFGAAFRDYDDGLRGFVDGVQEQAISFGLAMFAPRTEAAIAERNRMVAEMAGATPSPA